MIIWILILIFGLLFVLRIWKFNEQNRIFDNQTLKNVLLIITFLTLLCCLLLFERFFFKWLAVFTATVAVAVTIFVTVHFRERKFRQDFVDFLDRTLLQLRSGHSFRNSLEISNAKTPLSSQLKVTRIIEAVHFSQKIETADEFVREIFEELSSVQGFPHKTVDRLSAFRRKIKIEDDFRRRSGRIIRQVRIQIVFLLFLYLAVLGFVTVRFGFLENLKIILWSATLFLAGIGGFGHLGGKNQWKV